MLESSPRHQGIRPTAAWVAVTLLGLLYVLSFVDRIVLALLVQPLRADLGVSDVQLGLLFGVAFAFFYALVGLPLARLADRGNRRKLILCGVVLWSLCTIGSGFANNFELLVLFRIGLAIGEAVLTPCAYSMIADMFPEKNRSFAASMYTAAGMLGGSLSYVIGAAAIASVETYFPGGVGGFRTWQVVFLIVGAPGLVLAGLFALIVREPPRENGSTTAPGIAEVVTHIRSNGRLLAGLFGGAAFIQLITAAYGAWIPEFLRRAYGFTIQDAGFSYGTMGIIASVLGTLAAPMISQAIKRAGRTNSVAIVSGGGAVIGGLCMTLAPLQASPIVFFVLATIGKFCVMGAANNVPIALQHLAPARMRATLTTLCLMTIIFVGMGLGPMSTALLSNHVFDGNWSLGYALATVSGTTALISLSLFLWSTRQMGVHEGPSSSSITSASLPSS